MSEKKPYPILDIKRRSKIKDRDYFFLSNENLLILFMNSKKCIIIVILDKDMVDR